jgi:hypothetical protein
MILYNSLLNTVRGLHDDVQGNETSHNLDVHVIMLDDMDDMSIFNVGLIWTAKFKIAAM